MTGAIDLYNSAVGHAQFAATRAPAGGLKVPYAIMGAACSLSFGLGAKLRKLTFKEISAAPGSEINAAEIQKQDIGGCLAVVIPALVKTSEEIKMLQAAVNSTIFGSETIVIVVDDGSPRPLKTLLKGCLVVRHDKNKGPAAARNTGVAIALEVGASAIAFTDSDCQPDKEWASNHASLRARDPGVWAGRTVSAESGMTSEFHDRTGTLMPRLLSPSSSNALFAPTCNLSISREVALALQFDQSFPSSAFEDVDFCIRARAHNFEIKLSNSPVVKHAFKPGVLAMLQQYHKYGRSYPLLLERHPSYPQDLHRSIPLSAFPPVPSHRLEQPSNTQETLLATALPNAAGTLVAWTKLLTRMRPAAKKGAKPTV